MNCPCAKVLRGKTLDGARRRPISRWGARKPLSRSHKQLYKYWR